VSEPDRWLVFLGRLARGEVCDPIQVDAFMGLWTAATERAPALRRPAVTVSDETVDLSWSFVDVPGMVFVVHILPDGRLDWFYRDPARTLGADEGDEPRELPSDALEALAAAFGTPAQPQPQPGPAPAIP
jgi:hypothetical protein